MVNNKAVSMVGLNNLETQH